MRRRGKSTGVQVLFSYPAAEIALVVAAPIPSTVAASQVFGGVDVAAQARPGPGQLDGAGLTVALCRVGAEAGIEGNAEGEQRRGPAAVAVGDETAPVRARLRQRLAELAGLQGGQITLQHNGIRGASRVRRSTR